MPIDWSDSNHEGGTLRAIPLLAKSNKITEHPHKVFFEIVLQTMILKDFQDLFHPQFFTKHINTVRFYLCLIANGFITVLTLTVYNDTTILLLVGRNKYIVCFI